MIRGILFDLDGTLLDTLADLTDAVNAGLRHLGLGPQSADCVRQWIGEGQLLLCRRAIAAAQEKRQAQEKRDRSNLPGPKKGTGPICVKHPSGRSGKLDLSPFSAPFLADQVDDSTLAAMVPVFQAYYREHRLDKTVPYPGIIELLDALTVRGMKLAVYSNKPHEHTVPLVDVFFKHYSWSAVEGGREDRPKKPAPQRTREVLDALGLGPAEVLMVGDSAPDIQAGRNIGAKTVGVTWGLRSREELQAAGADHLIDLPVDFLRLLGSP
jgi:phosphoglycolate phosphatase